jgi:tripartite-type tricarboxylate transporter receptor subunit TctC
MTTQRRTILLSMASASALLLAPLAHAQAPHWPAKPITWIVPFAPGGPTDAMARDIADRTGKQLGQAIIVENAPGAGGTIGTAKAARAAADGYTFLVGHMGYMGAAPSLHNKLAYDPVRDFDPVFRFPDTPMVLMVGAKSRFKSADDLIQYAKAHPEKLNFSNAGVGSTSHLIAALFASRAGIKITSVAYKGAGPALNDLISGQVDAMFDQTTTALPQIGPRLKAIGVTTRQELPLFPDAPALGAKLIPDFEAATWYGIYAPKGTPEPIISSLHAAYLKALEDPAWTQRMLAQGIVLLNPSDYAPAALKQHTVDEVARWKTVVTETGITLD